MLSILVSDTAVTAVLAKGTIAKGSVEKVLTEELPEGVITNGMVTDAAKLVEVFKKIRKSTAVSTATLCLHPTQVYYTTVSVASSRGAAFRSNLERAIEERIPEERSKLLLQTKTLSRTGRSKTIGVIAARKDVVQGLRDVCTKAGLQVKSVTTLPLALGERGSTVLVASQTILPSTITYIAKGWPIDEVVLAEEATLPEELNALLAEYQTSFLVKNITVVGTTALMQTIQSMFTASTTEKKKESKQANMTVRRICGWVTEKNLPLLHAIIVALSGTRGMNLLRSQQQKTRTALLALVLVLTACLAAIAFLRPDLLPF